MSIFRFNQSGVASELTYGRKGGKLKWDTSGFQFLKPNGAPAPVFVADELDSNTLARVATITDVDRKVQGLRTKSAVKFYVDSNHDLTVAFTTRDSVTAVAGQRCLLAAQTDKKQNGIYVLDVDKKPIRAADANTYSKIEGAYVYVDDGTTYEGSGWVLNVIDDSNVNVAIDTFEIDVKQFHGQGSVKVQNGLKLVTGEIALAFDALAVPPSAVTSADTIVINKGAVSYKSTLSGVVGSLGIDGWRISDGDNSVSVATNVSTPRDSISFGVKATTTHAADSNVVDVSANAFKVKYNNAPIGVNQIGSSIELTAGNGNGARGGSVSLTAGDGVGTSMLGGDIVIRPGQATTVDTDDGIVRLEATSAVKLPYGTLAQRPSAAQAGMVRVSNTTVTGVDVLEYWDSQSVATDKWKTVGGSYRLSDLDNDTYISVADSAAGDQDTIKLIVGPTSGQYVAGTIVEASGVGFNVNVPLPSNTLTTVGGGISLTAANGATGGAVSITTGKSLQANGLGEGGKLSLKTQERGAIEMSSANIATGANASGAILVKTGDSQAPGSLTIQSGKVLGGTAAESTIDIGTDGATTLNVGGRTITGFTGTKVNVNGSSVVIGANAGALVGAATVTIGDQALSDTKLYGKDVFISASTTNGIAKVVGKEIHIGNDTATTQILIGNNAADTTNITLKGNDVTLQADNGMILKTSTANLNVQVQSTGTGVIEVTNPAYTASVTADSHITNRGYVSEVIRDARLGGKGVRSVGIDLAAQTGTSFKIGADLPSNARVTRITVDVYEAIIHTGAVAFTGDIVAATGTQTTLVTNNDIDLYSIGLYIIELPGRLLSGGAVNMNFNLDGAIATAGKMFINLEFNV